MNEHLLKSYDDELNKLRFRLVKMGTYVQQQIEMSVNSLLTNNLELAKQVFELEKKVDKLDIKIDKQCIKIIALHQPLARDLRLILAAIQINIYFEIIGDLATDIINDVLKMLVTPEIIKQTNISEMAHSVIKMINNVMDSFVEMNVELSLDVINRNDSIELLYKENFDKLVLIMNNNKNEIEACSYLVDINRHFQMIANLIRNIAQELVFLYDSKVVKHMKIDDINQIETDNEISEQN